MSLPARGEWIEISSASAFVGAVNESLPARGEWIEIIKYLIALFKPDRLSPHGESGLKCRAV